MATHYPHLLDPTIYPDYTRRHTKVPTWDTFDNTMQTTCIRFFNRKENRLVDYNHELDLYTEKFNLGRVIWAHGTTLHAENFKDLAQEMKRRGLYLFDLWAYHPGTETGPLLWQQAFIPPEGMVDYLLELMGDHFLGMDVGEHDGGYAGVFGCRQCPNSPDRFSQYPELPEAFRTHGRRSRTQGDGTAGSYIRPLLPEGGYYMLLGAETGQMLPNSQVFYAFIRGAGRQYGIHWFGNASVWNRWGYKTYEEEGQHDIDVPDGTFRFNYGPNWGTSLNLMKRLIYTHYLYNSVLAGFEDGWTTGDHTCKVVDGTSFPLEDAGDNVEISPLGRIQAGIGELARQYGQPGTMHAPVAVLLDFFSGWTFPRHQFDTNGPETLNSGVRQYEAWGCTPYNAGDYLTHGVLSLLYPGYEDSSYFDDERGHLSPTPFGDMADCVLSDIPAWVMRQYGLVVAAGALRVDRELADKLRGFVEGGGQVVVTAENVRGLIPGLEIADKPERIAGGATIQWADSSTHRETKAFDLYEVRLPDGAEVRARCAGKPAVARIKQGRGYWLVMLSPYGLNAEPAVTELENRVLATPGVPPHLLHAGTHVPCPYTLLDHVRRSVSDELSAQQLFSVGEGLGFITNRRGPCEYTLGIYNNDLSSKPFEIQSLCGAVASITELEVDQSEKGQRGYWPNAHMTNDVGKGDQRNIAGGDIRLFNVKLEEENLTLASPSPPARPIGQMLALRGDSSIQKEILARPTFFEHFEGVKVDFEFLHARDPRQLRGEEGWLRRQGVKVVVDFSHGLNHFPGITLMDNLPSRYEESIGAIDDVLEKMTIIGASDAIISLHWKPQCSPGFSDQMTSEHFVHNVRALADRAAKLGITAHIQHHPRRWHETAAAMLDFVDEVARPNLKFALNLGHLLMTGEDLRETITAAGVRLGAVLLCVPVSDVLGRMVRRSLFDTRQWHRSKRSGRLQPRPSNT